MKKSFGKNITDLRGDRTQIEVATATGIAIRALVDLEKGRRWPQYRNLVALAEYYKKTPDQLLATTQLVIPARKPTAMDALEIIREELAAQRRGRRLSASQRAAIEIIESLDEQGAEAALSLLKNVPEAMAELRAAESEDRADHPKKKPPKGRSHG